jgi:hypothetical protein
MAASREGHVKPTTFVSYEGLLTKHILPVLDETPISRIRPLAENYYEPLVGEEDRVRISLSNRSRRRMTWSR